MTYNVVYFDGYRRRRSVVSAACVMDALLIAEGCASMAGECFEDAEASFAE